MKKYYILLLFCTAITHISNSMEPQNIMTSIDSFNEATKILDGADENTLILFDVDNTLIMSRNFPSREIRNNLHNYSILIEHDETVVIEPTIVDRIKSLQERSRVLALTSIHSKSLGTINSVPQSRYVRLKRHGIDFQSTHFSENGFFSVDDADAEPKLHNGILATDGYPKGKVVLAFLNYVEQHKSWNPSRIIFFDDIQDNIISVANALRERNIEFHGFLYNGASHREYYQDDNVTSFQLKHFKKHKIWLSIEEVCDLMEAAKEEGKQLTEEAASNTTAESRKEEESQNSSSDLPITNASPRRNIRKMRRILNKWFCCRSAPISPENS